MSASEVQVARLRAEIVNSKELPTIPVLLVRIIEVVDGERTSAKDAAAAGSDGVGADGRGERGRGPDGVSRAGAAASPSGRAGSGRG